MIKSGTTVEYNGYTLKKKGKSAWTISKDNFFGYTTTLKKAKEIVDRRLL